MKSLLSHRETRRLLALAKTGDEDALAALIERNQGLVMSIAVRHAYRAGAHTIQDLMQEGNHGLVEAIQRFDLDRRLRFSTYATWRIRYRIARFCDKNQHTIGIPQRQVQRMNSLSVVNDISTRDLAECWRMPEYVVAALFHATRPTSLESDVDKSPLGELIPGEENPEDAVLNGVVCQDALAIIEDMEAETRECLKMFIGIECEAPLTAAEIAATLDLNEKTVKRRITTGIKELRYLLGINLE